MRSKPGPLVSHCWLVMGTSPSLWPHCHSFLPVCTTSYASPRCAELCWEQCLKSCWCDLRGLGSWGLTSLCAVGRARRSWFDTCSCRSREMLAMPLERWDGQHRTCRLRTRAGTAPWQRRQLLGSASVPAAHSCAALIHPLLQSAEMACGLAVIAQCAAMPP